MSRICRLCRWPSKLRRRARRSRMVTMLLLVAIICVLVTPFYVIYKPPTLLIRYFQYRWPDVLWRVPTSSKIIALTIDDAPSKYTEEILEILQENDAKATFFVIGSQVEGREDRLRDIVRSGNELGNHAMHDEPSRALVDTTLVSQIKFVENVVLEAYAAAGAE